MSWYNKRNNLHNFTEHLWGHALKICARAFSQHFAESLVGKENDSSDTVTERNRPALGFERVRCCYYVRVQMFKTCLNMSFALLREGTCKLFFFPISGWGTKPKKFYRCQEGGIQNCHLPYVSFFFAYSFKECYRHSYETSRPLFLNSRLIFDYVYSDIGAYITFKLKIRRAHWPSCPASY